jgi:hypothetical protein
MLISFPPLSSFTMARLLDLPPQEYSDSVSDSDDYDDSDEPSSPLGLAEPYANQQDAEWEPQWEQPPVDIDSVSSSLLSHHVESAY